MPTYTPKSPESNATPLVVPPGLYEVEITKAVERQSQAGNPMISLTIDILLPGGKIGPTIYDSLVFTDKATWKIDQFLASIGQSPTPGEPIEINAEDLIGETGLAEIDDEPGTKNPDMRFNKVARWVFGDERAEFLRAKRASAFAQRVNSPAPATRPTPQGDDIPF